MSDVSLNTRCRLELWRDCTELKWERREEKEKDRTTTEDEEEEEEEEVEEEDNEADGEAGSRERDA